jgi:hypothetical protein
MNLIQHFKLSVRGSFLKRIGYLLDLVSLGFVPVHTSVSCEQSGGIAGLAFFNMLLVLALCLFTPRSDSNRFLPAVLGIFVLVLHMLSAH